MSYNLLRVLHILGILMVFLSLGGAIIRAALNDSTESVKKNIAMLHGVGLLLLLATGFGLVLMVAKMGGSFGGWIAVKFVIWLILGGAVAMLGRMQSKAGMLGYVILALGAVAATMALYKPF